MGMSLLEKLNLVVATNRVNKDFLGEKKQEKKNTNKLTNKNQWSGQSPEPEKVGLHGLNTSQARY